MPDIRQARIQESTGELVALMLQKGWLVELNQIVMAIKEVRASLERLKGEVGMTTYILRQMILGGNFNLRGILDSIVSIGAALSGEEGH